MKPSKRDLTPHPMRLFEENYLLIRRLLPQLQAGARFVLSAGQGRNALQIQVGECGRYTACMTVSKPFEGDMRWLPPLSLQVRVYHDARLAEVIGYQDCGHIPPAYAVSLGDPYHRDERKQVNRLLHEVLSRCLGRGYRALSDCTDAA